MVVSLNSSWKPIKLERNKFQEILQKIALSNEDDQLIRPTFPNQAQLAASEEAYNLQLLSVRNFWKKI